MNLQNWLQLEMDRMKTHMKSYIERNKTSSDIRRTTNSLWSSGHKQVAPKSGNSYLARGGHSQGTSVGN